MRERNANADAVAAMLPLLPATFHILVALAAEDRHGYAIIQDVAARTGGAIRLSPGTLYRSIQRMLDDGLIVETDERPSPEQVRLQILREGATLATVGLILGLMGTYVLGRTMQSMLFGTGALNLPVILATVLVLLGTALAACYVPARRASAVDPLIALRHS
jgi:hypothetical protein